MSRVAPRAVASGRAMPRVVLLALASAATACASSGTVELPPLESPIGDELPAGFEPSVQADIDASLAGVELPRAAGDATGTDAASVLVPSGHLDPDEIRGLIRQLESLDGETPVVCLPTRGYVFGECAFPPSRGDAPRP